MLPVVAWPTYQSFCEPLYSKFFSFSRQVCIIIQVFLVKKPRIRHTEQSAARTARTGAGPRFRPGFEAQACSLLCCCLLPRPPSSQFRGTAPAVCIPAGLSFVGGTSAHAGPCTRSLPDYSSSLCMLLLLLAW